MDWLVGTLAGDRVAVWTPSWQPDAVYCSVDFVIDDVDAVAGSPRAVVLTPDEADDLAGRLATAAACVRADARQGTT